MNDHNTAHPDAMPVALLLYSPAKGTNYETDPLGALPREDLVTSYERQWYRFEFEGKHYALRPTQATHSPFNYLWPDASEPDGELARRLGGWHHHRGLASRRSHQHHSTAARSVEHASGVGGRNRVALSGDDCAPERITMGGTRGVRYWAEPWRSRGDCSRVGPASCSGARQGQGSSHNS